MKNVLIVSHDAGGAEIISSWVQKNYHQSIRFLLEGPAVKIFKKKIENLQYISKEDAFGNINAFDFIVTGTSWGSDIEKQIIRAAQKAEVYVASYLDHWTNYQTRFFLDSVTILPNEIWVGDDFAFSMATELFPNSKIKLEPNQYFVDSVKKINSIEISNNSCSSGKRILYVCEPRTMKYGFADYWGYDEYQAMEGFLFYLSKQPLIIEKICVRLHPSEEAGKYDAILHKFSNQFLIRESACQEFYYDCAWANYVVGCDSMAMVIALLAGKQVFSCIPMGGRKMTLPFMGIKQLFQ